MEHLEGVIEKPEADMTPQELQLHYFKMHDYDGNNLLDGLELATAITHVHKEVGEFSALGLTVIFSCNICSLHCKIQLIQVWRYILIQV